MTSTDHQLALFKSSSHIHHPPVVPPNVAEKPKAPFFIQKLFEVVNSPESTDVITWSSAGDSFFIFDHERLEKEVIPRWFKHHHFSGFVCHLRSYSFHRISHPQQGVLSSDNNTERWNFAHPDFIRGHPELLLRIRRKKQNSQVQRQQQQQADEAATAASVTDGNGNSVVGMSSSRSGAIPLTGLVPLSRL